MQSRPRLLLLFGLLCLARVSLGGEVLFVISCPPHASHSCRGLREHLRQQQQVLAAIPSDYDYAIKVHIMHELFNYWTLLDALPHLRGQARLLNARTEWIIWCQANTHVSSLRALLGQLQRRNAKELAYYGHALHDVEATIVHHFAHYKNPTWFPYPMLSAGVVFTGALLHRLAELVAANAPNARRHSEFAIDAAHELARFIFDNLTPAMPNDDEGTNSSTTDGNSTLPDDDSAGSSNMLQRKIILKSAAYICPSASLSPAGSLPSSGMQVGKPKQKLVAKCNHFAPQQVHTSGAHIYFAIKTCAKFHKERIPIIERTWAPDAIQRKYYSDVADAAIPTISTGIPNVASGHCAKTLSILQLSLKDIDELAHIRWLMLVDDDTLLRCVCMCVSMRFCVVPRLSALLSCLNHTEHVYLGERYGYRLYAPDGFNYHTGGAGIVFSVPLLRLIVQRCSCPTANAPDDMILGYCLQALGVPARHAVGLHQARPQDYAPELLQLNAPISFHKYLHTSPEHTFKRWLGGASGNRSALAKQQAGDRHTHRERRDVAPLELNGQRLLQLAHVAPGLDGAAKHLDL
ncbi:hypothetical protein KR222_001715 [Zaprionus bogoriensis]|nr:hypothetical protein KR222_001715 [Zaprionus bogoriensis]